MGRRGPKPVSAQGIHLLATRLYWDFLGLAHGTYREWFNPGRFDKEMRKEAVRLDERERDQIVKLVNEEIESGKLHDRQRPERLRGLEADMLWMKQAERAQHATERALQHKKVRGEPDVLKGLLRAKDPEKIRCICKDAHTVIRAEVWGEERDICVENWPIEHGSLLPEYLTQHAEQFIEARRDPRFPHSGRESTQLKQLWFLARALAGAVSGLKTRTAMNLVGSMRPEQLFSESRAGKPIRKRKLE
jgi:hypothetical protein